MSASSNAAPVALRPFPASQNEDLQPEDIHRLMAQLLQERGGQFRNLTEQSFIEEMNAAEGISQSASSEAGRAEDLEMHNPKERQKELREAREKMLIELNYAIFYTRAAADLLVLTVPKENPAIYEKNLGVDLKNLGVPKAAFGLTRGTKPDLGDPEKHKLAEAEQRRLELIAKGSRMIAFQSAADHIFKATKRLETEVRKETVYWDEVLSISEKGWRLRRLHQKGRSSALAVRYGYAEAGPRFKGRGLAPLRMNETGGIILDPALTQGPKTIRVRVREEGKITGISQLPPLIGGYDAPIEELIQLSRESLFEEELFYEASMATRALQSFGVELQDSVIRIPAPVNGKDETERTILIDCIDRNDGASISDSHERDNLAKNVAEFLRVLLHHEHRMRLHRRTQIPSLLSSAKRAKPSTPILNILLQIFAHMSALEALRGYLSRTAQTLSSAGLEVKVDMAYETTWVKATGIITQSSRTDLNALDKLLDLLANPLESNATLTIPSNQHEQINVTTRTFMGAPTFGTEYKVTIPASTASILLLPQDDKRESKYPNAAEVISYLDWVLALDLAHMVIPKVDQRIVSEEQDSRCTLTVQQGYDDAMMEFQVGVLDGSLSLEYGWGERSVSEWDGSPQKESLKEKIRSLCDSADTHLELVRASAFAAANQDGGHDADSAPGVPLRSPLVHVIQGARKPEDPDEVSARVMEWAERVTFEYAMLNDDWDELDEDAQMHHFDYLTFDHI